MLHFRTTGHERVKHTHSATVDPLRDMVLASTTKATALAFTKCSWN
jgi:hypothetical protein